MLLGVIFLAIWLVAGLVIGIVVGSQNKPVGIDATNSSDVKCDTACQQWEKSRIEICRAKNQVALFQSRVDSTSRRLVAATAIHVGLVAAAVAAAFIPFVGLYIAVGIAAAAVIALGVVSMLAGELAAEDASLRQAQGIEMQAQQLESEARILLVQTCTPEKANECLSRPSPC